MKILHILDHSIPLHSGYTFRTRAIIRQQRAFGWQTEHLTSGKHTLPSPAEEEVEGLHFFRTPPMQNSWLTRLPGLEPLAIIRALEQRLQSVVEQTRPDILHAHSPALTGVAALRVGKRTGLPVVYECRGFWEDAAVDHGTCREGDLRYRLTRALESWVFKRADAVTTICQGLRQDILARGIAAEKITVIPNAVDIEHFPLITAKDTDLQAQLQLGDSTVLGFIGSFYGYEGLPLLLEALAKLIKQQPDVKLLLVGGGPDETHIRTRMAELGLQQQVILTGRVPHTEVARYYSLVDILVYPRLPMRLTDRVTPLKPLEAMAQGKLVVASDVGGHRELIEDGVTGRLFPAGDANALAATLQAVLAQPQDWPAYHRRGRAFVEQQRNWAVSVGNYRQVYPQLLQGRP